MNNRPTYEDAQRLLAVARGQEKAPLVLKNARVLNVFTGELLEQDVAICGDRIAGVGVYEGAEEIDLKGQALVPGFIDGHMHLESSMMTPRQFARAVGAGGAPPPPPPWSPTPTKLPTCLGLRASIICSTALRDCRWTCGSCAVPACPQLISRTREPR